jgi:hypothetical protein
LYGQKEIRKYPYKLDFINNFKYFNYHQYYELSNAIKNKIEEITDHPDYQLNLENDFDRETLLLATLSLVEKKPIITNNLE